MLVYIPYDYRRVREGTGVYGKGGGVDSEAVRHGGEAEGRNGGDKNVRRSSG